MHNLESIIMRLIFVICIVVLISACVENPYKPGNIAKINITGTASVIGPSEPKQMIFYADKETYIVDINYRAFSVILPNNHTYSANVRWKDVLGRTGECDAGLFNVFSQLSNMTFTASC